MNFERLGRHAYHYAAQADVGLQGLHAVGRGGTPGDCGLIVAAMGAVRSEADRESSTTTDTSTAVGSTGAERVTLATVPVDS